MTRIVIRSRVGSDGVLHLTMPVGKAKADQEVVVTVEDPPPATVEDREAWLEFIEQTAGKWQGDLERPEPLPLETREPWQ